MREDTTPAEPAATCNLHENERTRVQHKTTGRIGWLSSPYSGMGDLYTEVKWLNGPTRGRTQEATRHLAVIGTDRYCLTHRDWEQATPASEPDGVAAAEVAAPHTGEPVTR